MQPHIYEGNGKFCLKCFKDLNHVNHFETSKDSLVDKEDIILNVPVVESSIFPVSCKGHTCTKCGSIWNHDYDCENRSSETICSKCISNAAVLINREDNLDSMAVSFLTAREAKEIAIEHESFINLHIFRLPDGKDNPNWLEDWQNHYNNLDAMIEKLRVKQSQSLRSKAKKQVEETIKLSPEEREEYEKLARARKSKPTKDNVDKNREDKKKAYDKALKDIAKTLLGMGLASDEDTAIEQARLSLEKKK